ncbi:hypothetical protein NEF87_000701 [Candidatus Lokiarchaeum ossiferum]|uniref:Flagellin n=1 Tax=Candidatus Lokiarchaeum ossiferum TaxID=2951803 RepID=A0ABY6HPF1_9ARCH|nr:hypothetical protein NEF87_000701 [Candidatus Lokiarchaeum sp. B-35]
MSDNAVSTGIMSTASIVTTIVVIAAAFTVAAAIGASINNSGQNFANQINTDFEVLAIGNTEAGNSTIYGYVKNLGDASVGSFSEMDVFLDGDYYYLDSADTSLFRWNATILNDNGNNIWDPLETIIVRMYFPDGESINSGSHQIVIAISGISEIYQFSI